MLKSIFEKVLEKKDTSYIKEYFKEIYLIYIDEIHNVSIDETSEDYEKYMKLSKIK